MSRIWTGYNNVGLSATALAVVLEQSGRLPISKAVLVMPLVMHDATVSFLSKATIRRREAAALASVKPEFFANFNSRFESSLVLSLNAIQLLIHLGYARLAGELLPATAMQVDEGFGKRAVRIAKAAPNISALLASPVEELYANFRVQL